MDKLIDAKLEKVKSEHDNKLKELEREHDNKLKELERDLSNLRAQLHESDNWLVHGVRLFSTLFLTILLNLFRTAKRWIKLFYEIYWTERKPS